MGARCYQPARVRGAGEAADATEVALGGEPLRRAARAVRCSGAGGSKQMDSVTKLSPAIAVWLTATTAAAQQAPAPAITPGQVDAWGETMRTGLVPLFTAIGAGIGIMLLAAMLTILVVRTTGPRVPTEA